MSRPDGERPDDQATDYVRSALRDAAQAYQPNRTAMVNRVASGRAAARAKARRGFYPIAAAFAVAVIVVLSVVAVRSTGDDGTRPDANPPAAARPSAPSAPRTSASASPAPKTSASRPATGAPNGAVTATGGIGANSVATWSESTVTIANARTLTALRVTITVAATPGTAAAGKYTTVPNSDLTMTVTTSGSALTYSYVLKQGTTLAPGSYLFAAQFDHRSGRSLAKDSYAVTGATRSTQIALSGAFI